MIVTEPMRGRLQYFKRDPRFQVILGLRERFQLLIGRHHRPIVVHLAFLPLRIRPNLRKEAGAMKIDIGIEMLLIEDIDERRPALRNVRMAKEFSDHRPILTFDEGIIVGLASTGFGEVDEELAQEGGDSPIDVLRAIVRMKAPDEERKRVHQLSQSRDEKGFTDFLHGTDPLELRDLIHRIDVVDAFVFVPIPLMHGIEAKKAGLPVRVGFPAFADGGTDGPSLLD